MQRARAPLYQPLAVAGAITGLIALLALVLPEALSGTLVGAAFLSAVYLLVLAHPTHDPKTYGLSLGGLLDQGPIRVTALAHSLGRALAFALAAALLLFPFYWLGYIYWWRPSLPFDFSRTPSLEEALGHVFAIALPEEAFYRGYLQSTLSLRLSERAWSKAQAGAAAILVTSLVFALGHLATEPAWYRLAVFFPSLVFGLLRQVTGGIGTPIIFHASCNLLSLYLARGYGFLP